MGNNRRNFLKTIGVVGGSLTFGKSFAAGTKKSENKKEFYAILYDSTRCFGCQSCEVACAVAYNFPAPEDYPDPAVVRKTNTSQRVVVNAIETENGEQYMRSSCNHCSSPACASACLTKAMHKTEEGPVIWREDKCMGCRSCMIACPYNVPKFEYDSPNPKIQKCRMCYEKLVEGSTPECVSACPAEAMIFGKRRDLIDLARERIYSDPDSYHHEIYGEHEVGGTGLLYLTALPPGDLGLRTDLGTVPFPEHNKTFLYSVPAVLVLWPAFLLGLRNASDEVKNNLKKS